MLIDGNHKAWCGTTLTLLAVASGGYVAYARAALGGPRGGSVPGLIFGVAGSALMIYAGLISARKKAPTWRIGSAQTWLRGHLWLGSLSIPLILFHAGFRWGGPVEQALLLVLAAIVASGIFGLVLQQFLPRQMTARVPLETFYAQVPHVCRVLEVEADVAVAQLCGPLPIAVNESDDVATLDRLNQLGVTGKNPLAAVYASAAESSEAPATRGRNADAEHGAGEQGGRGAGEIVVRETSRAVREPPGPTTTPKAVSAADKIALMRAAKAIKKPAEAAAAPASAASEPANSAAPEKPKAALSAADKIALMRAAKAMKKPDEATATPAQAAPEPANSAAPEKAKAALSAADKIGLMRAAKATKKPDEATAAPASATSEPANSIAPEKPKAALSAADKTAMMRAAKAAKTPDDAVAKTPENAAATLPTAAEKPSSAAEKIALMRAGKAALAGKPTTPAAPARSPIPAATPTAKPTPAVRPKAADDDAWKEARPEFIKFYLEQVRPFLGVNYLRQSLLADGVQAEGQFAAVGAVLPEPLRPLLTRLAALCEERRQLAAQVRMHHWLHGWLLLHVPLSFALLALGVVHVIASLYY